MTCLASIRALAGRLSIGAAIALGLGSCAVQRAPDDGAHTATVGSALSVAQDQSGLPCPVLYYPLDQCKGGVYVGPGARGPLACGAGKYGAAVTFNGGNDAIDVPDQPAFHATNQLTLSAWVNPSNLAGLHTILNKWYYLDSYMLLVVDGRYEFRVAFPDGSLGTQVAISAPATAGVWTHVTGVFDGTQLKLYLNGTLAASLPHTGPLQDSSRPLVIGNNPPWNAFQGQIDELRLYDVALSDGQVHTLANLDATAQAVALVDHRLVSELGPELDQYRCAASARRDFPVVMHDVVGIDDWSHVDVKQYLIEQRNLTGTPPRLEGALFVGNIRIPIFCLNYGWTIEHGLIPSYYEDLDATYTADAPPAGCPEPFDFSEITPGPNAGPELWSAFMPVGFSDPARNTYPDYAAQLRPALAKATAYERGEKRVEKRFYQVSNQLWYTLAQSWDYYTAAGIDFYSINPDPRGTIPDGTPAEQYCLSGGRTPADCYVRAATEAYPSFDAFWNYAQTREWMGENWQVADIYLPHMAAHTYEFVWVNTHANEWWSIVSSDQARSMTGGGIVMTGSGCDVGRFSQPHPNSVVSGAYPAENLLTSYVYGTSDFVAATGTTFTRQWEPVFGELVALSHSEPYLGKAYLENRRNNGMSQLEILIGDPFLDFRAPTCTDGVSNGSETGVDCGGPSCTACAAGQPCSSAADCATGSCVAGVCATPVATIGAALQIFSDWGSGYCAQVNVSNTGSVATSTWNVVLDVRTASITNVWNATDTVVGPANVHRFTALAWNAALAPGAQTSFGFCANRSGPSTPSVTGTSATAAAPVAGATATLTVTSDWSTGYCAHIALANTGTKPTNGWRVGLDVGESSFTSTWGFVDQLDAQLPTLHALSPLAYNAVVWPSSSTDLGFCAAKTGSNWQPTVVSVASW